MKKHLPLSVIFVSLLQSFSFSQGTWTQKTDVGGTARYVAVGFSIGTKGYIGTGNNPNCSQDFWEWDQTNNIWTQKAAIGAPRSQGTGFSIGTKGYIGTGSAASCWNNTNDFWEWDQANNTWTQKTSLAGSGRVRAVGFSIGTKGFIGTGNNGTINLNDFWEWDQTTDIWTQKSTFGGTARYNAIGFSIGQKGYIGTGTDGTVNLSDFWEWDQVTNTWTQKADFGGGVRSGAIGFSMGTNGYIGTGSDSLTRQDFWVWNQSTNTWAQMSNFGGGVRYWAVGFSVGNKGYIGTGDNAGYNKKDFWEFIPPGISGTIFKSDSITEITSGKVFLINNVPGVQFAYIDSFSLNGTNGNYSFSNVFPGNYLILTKPNSTAYPNAIPTYYGDTVFWQGATNIALTANDTGINIRVKEFPPLAGIGLLKGRIQYGIGSGKTGNDSVAPFGDPVPDIDIILEEIPGGIKAHTTTDNNGNYVFDLVPINAKYAIIVDFPTLLMDSTYIRILNSDNTEFTNLDFVIDTTSGDTGIFIGWPLSTKELIIRDLEFKIYPNPNDGIFTLELTNSQNQASDIKIYNVIGELIYQTTLKSKKQTVTFTAPAGIYKVQIENEAGIFSRKIIVIF